MREQKKFLNIRQQAVQDYDPSQKGNQLVEPQGCPGFLAEGAFQSAEQGGIYQAERSCIAELRFREAKGSK